MMVFVLSFLFVSLFCGAVQARNSSIIFSDFQFVQFLDLFLLRFCLVFIETIYYIYYISAIYRLEQDSCSMKDYLPYDRSPTKASSQSDWPVAIERMSAIVSDQIEASF